MVSCSGWILNRLFGTLEGDFDLEWANVIAGASDAALHGMRLSAELKTGSEERRHDQIIIGSITYAILSRFEDKAVLL